MKIYKLLVSKHSYCLFSARVRKYDFLMHENNTKGNHAKDVSKIILDLNCSEKDTCFGSIKYGHSPYSRGTKVEKMLTLAPERYTARFCMVARVILWCI